MLPVEVDGRPYIAFGGTNNMLDVESAARERRPKLNLPVVGLIPLGSDGVHPALAAALLGRVVGSREAEPLARRLRVVRETYYRVADPYRNSQVVELTSLAADHLAARYEPGRSANGGYAVGDGLVSVRLAR